MDQDDDLMVQFAKGSKKAFTTVYTAQYAAIFYLAKNLLNDPDIAADITADSFYKLWTFHENFNNLQAIKAFLGKVTRNACFNHLRDTKSRKNVREELHFLLAQENVPDKDVFRQRELKSAFMTEVFAAMKSLPRQCARVFELSYLDGLTNEELAEALNISNKTVRNQKVLALKLLRGIINKDSTLMLLASLVARH